MAYPPLTAGKQDIRLITIIPAPDVTEDKISLPNQQDNALNDIIQCQLEQVRLESLETPQTREENPADNSYSQIDWGDRCESSAGGDSPKWRYSWGDYVALSYAWGDLKEK